MIWLASRASASQGISPRARASRLRCERIWLDLANFGVKLAANDVDRSAPGRRKQAPLRRQQTLIMALTDFTITAADVGRVLGVPDGYLVNLAMIQGPVNETPSFEGKQKLTSNYFVLRGSRDWCDLVCVSPVYGGGYAEWRGSTGNMVVSGSIRYSGDLAVVAVPRGTQWSLTLSDIPM